jgi:hypothetical protein
MCRKLLWGAVFAVLVSTAAVAPAVGGADPLPRPSQSTATPVVAGGVDRPVTGLTVGDGNRSCPLPRNPGGVPGDDAGDQPTTDVLELAAVNGVTLREMDYPYGINPVFGTLSYDPSELERPRRVRLQLVQRGRLTRGGERIIANTTATLTPNDSDPYESLRVRAMPSNVDPIRLVVNGRPEAAIDLAPGYPPDLGDDDSGPSDPENVSAALPTVGSLALNETHNGLTAPAVAALFSGDRDRLPSGDETRNLTPTERLAAGTDVTALRPSAASRVWTRNDFGELPATDWQTAVYPSDATRRDAGRIADAHVTTFGLHPATVAHVGGERTRTYVAPEGRLRALVDYRVSLPDDRLPDRARDQARRRVWCYESSSVTDVTLERDGDQVAAASAVNQTPVVPYSLPADAGRTTLTVSATVQTTVRTRRDVLDCPEGNGSCSWSYGRPETRRQNHTVTDSRTVTVYAPSATAVTATYPNGDRGVALYEPQPWQGFGTPADEDPLPDRIRGVWRFYTARDRSWDVLVRADGEERTPTPSPALPVYTHAFASTVGPQSTDSTDVQLLRTWGERRNSPAPSIPERVNTGVVDTSESFEATHGLAVRIDDLPSESVSVEGIVHTADGRVVADGDTRTVRRTNLTASLLRTNDTHALVRVELRDNRTGAPIATHDRPEATAGTVAGLGDALVRDGYVTVDGRRVHTNESGVAVVAVDEPGRITVTYHPEHWLGVQPAYARADTTVTWSRATGFWWWVGVAVDVLWVFVPFLFVLWLGRRAGRLFAYERL